MCVCGGWGGGGGGGGGGAKLASYAQPACLPPSPETGGKAGVTGSGWGAERDNASSGLTTLTTD